MCGFAGIIGCKFSKDSFERSLHRMGDAIAHRGPDDWGAWLDCDAKVGLVHRRLSILDLTPAGHQPMISASSRFIIVFNGEIYNHLDIRSRVAGLGLKEWQGHSDTETLLAGFDALGIEETLREAIGMFALAVWDRQKRTLNLSRDRMGEKPLYYGYAGDALVFGSELKALVKAPGFAPRIDRGALASLLRYGYVPAPHTIYQDFTQLPPATMLEVSGYEVQHRAWPAPRAYWSAKAAAEAGAADPLTFASDDEAADGLETTLRQAVAEQMVADVPVGAFLSGGTNSSLVVALMQAQASRAVKTFTIGFNESGYDEAVFAKKVARHLGTEHTELYVSPQEALNVIPKLPEIYCEPFSELFANPQLSDLPTRAPACHRVALRRWRRRTFRRIRTLFCNGAPLEQPGAPPLALRRMAANTIKSIPPGAWTMLSAPFAGLIPERHRRSPVGEKLHRGAGFLHFETGLSLYRHMVSKLSNVVPGADEHPTAFEQGAASLPSLTEQMMLLDTVSYLPDDILVKVDRAAMAVSLETRAPLLDHRLYEYAWRLPLHYKVRDGHGKWLLRQVLYRHVPKEIVDRPKKGFSVPIKSWLRGPLRDWAEDLLDKSRLRAEGYLNPAPIRRKWNEHLSGKQNWQDELWGVLMFQAWLGHWGHGSHLDTEIACSFS